MTARETPDPRDPAALEAVDTAARAHALDVRRSWLVQAPAGSGKTELLVQRILALLAVVDEPERIVATTFTVKAAHEMRARVMRALADARAAVAPASEHQRHTLMLASAALARDEIRGWALLDYPGRLDIGTLDALAQRIAHQAPIASALGNVPPVDTEPRRLHTAAAHAALGAASADGKAWRTLLGHFDNDAGRVVHLLASLLAQRDQWLPALVRLTDQEARAALEEALGRDVTAVLAEVRDALATADAEAAGADAPFLEELQSLLRYGAQNRVEDAAFAALAGLDGLPDAHHSALIPWRALCDFLLVKSGAQFRSMLDTRLGFPAIGQGTGAKDRRDMNERARAWFERARRAPGLAALLHRARRLPEPRYSDDARALIDALVEVLPLVVAQLTLVFAEQGACDFTEVTLRAIAALGDADAPTEVLLAHDLRIEHLLVDEFQDTSQVQLGLLARLTAGWSPDDGRTLFAVGDPMQSIYRFREADVRIFLKAATEGLVGNVPVERLQLARNFRSQARLVDEVNAVFPRVLAAHTRLQRAEVAFAAASAVLPATDDEMTFELVPDAIEEAERVVAHVRGALAAGLRDVAILARARSHFAAIHQALRGAGIAYQAVKLESLAERPVTLDLLWLARALTQPADRHAWLTVLRAPWCALKLPDLLAIADAAKPRGWGAVARDTATLALLSADGAARLSRFNAAIADALERRDMSLTLRVRAAWLALGGPACYGADKDAAGGAVDLLAADAFFAALARHERGGDLPDWERFVDAIATLQSEPPTAADTRVKLMTLHAAKGLEFDAVILPGLGNITRGGDQKLLRWRTQGGDLIIGSPPARANTEDDPIERYLRDVEADEEQAELARLLYVGFTRARHRLHLVARAGTRFEKKEAAWQWKEPGRRTALGALWPALEARAPAPWDGGPGDAPAGFAAAEPLPQPLARLPLDHHGLPGVGPASPLPAAPASPAPGSYVAGALAGGVDDAASSAAVEPVYDWANATAAVIGTIVHRLFAQVATEGLDRWPLARIGRLAPRLGAELKSAGVPANEQGDALLRIETSLRNTLEDERGRWLLDAAHSDAASEWALSASLVGDVQHLVLDRSFVAEGVRWIVDFKTSRHEGGGLAQFLAREQERHRPQLERYARAVAQLDRRPIMLALYYPLLREFLSFPWVADPPAG